VQGDARNNPAQNELAEIINPERISGTLADALKNADVFIGVSAANVANRDMIADMNKGAIVFAMANPVPEIMPDEAKAGGAFIVGTGRSDFPNQVNNVLAFPGIFRGALDVRAKNITEEMKLAAAYAIAEVIKEEELTTEYVIPDAFDKRVALAVAKAVADVAVRTGVARVK